MLRTQVRPAIEFVSGKEGLRPRIAVFVSRSSARLAYFVVQSAPVVRRTPDTFPFLVPVQ